MVKGMEAWVGLAELFGFDVAIKVMMDIGAKYTNPIEFLRSISSLSISRLRAYRIQRIKNANPAERLRDDRASIK